MAVTVTIKIAEAGTALTAGGKSIAGHIWIETSDISRGFGPSPSGGDGLGMIIDNDNTRYAKTVYSRSVEISDDQFALLRNYLDRPEEFGFSKIYNAVGNSCVDYIWKAIQIDVGIQKVSKAMRCQAII